MNRVFDSQIERNMEVYVNDMIVKSELPSSHIVDLEETFHQLRTFKICLNPKKCVFGVNVGKFLRFMVS